jgi:acyl-coenzyme A thioesterase PaaI-like protein
MQRFFKAEDGAENVADWTASTACHKYVGDMIHEARVQAHVDYYRSVLKQPLDKTHARLVTLSREQYLQVGE